MSDTCCVADQLCTCAANFEEQPTLRAECFVCGEKVCTECSSRRKYLHYGRKRICNNCQEDMDGNSDTILKRLRNKLAST